MVTHPKLWQRQITIFLAISSFCVVFRYLCKWIKAKQQQRAYSNKYQKKTRILFLIDKYVLLITWLYILYILIERCTLRICIMSNTHMFMVDFIIDPYLLNHCFLPKVRFIQVLNKHSNIHTVHANIVCRYKESSHSTPNIIINLYTTFYPIFPYIIIPYFYFQKEPIKKMGLI